MKKTFKEYLNEEVEKYKTGDEKKQKIVSYALSSYPRANLRTKI